MGRLKPLTVHLISGVGLPSALHLSDTQGPGCKVWSMNEYNSLGRASIKTLMMSVKFFKALDCRIIENTIRIQRQNACIIHLPPNRSSEAAWNSCEASVLMKHWYSPTSSGLTELIFNCSECWPNIRILDDMIGLAVLIGCPSLYQEILIFESERGTSDKCVNPSKIKHVSDVVFNYTNWNNIKIADF